MSKARKSAPAKKAARKTSQKQKRGSSAAVERRVHTPEVAGSTPAPASTPRPPQVSATPPLALLHERFVHEYLKDSNGTRAFLAIKPHVKESTATVEASKLLRIPRIAEAIRNAQAEAIAKVQKDTGITLERTLREIARLAYFHAGRLFDAKGNPLAVTELDDDTAAVIAGLDVLEEFEGAGKDRVFVGYVKKWKLADKHGALDMLMKELGGYSKDNEQAGKAAGASLSPGWPARIVEPGTQ